jgi:twitching motility protein PilT
VNVYQQRDALGAAFRLIPFEIKKLDDLGLPAWLPIWPGSRAGSSW